MAPPLYTAKVLPLPLLPSPQGLEGCEIMGAEVIVLLAATGKENQEDDILATVSKCEGKFFVFWQGRMRSFPLNPKS